MNRWNALFLLVILTILPAWTVRAQCADPDCLDDGTGPQVGVSAGNGETYILDEGASVVVDFTAFFFDLSGVNSSTIAVRFNGQPVTNWTWTPRPEGTNGSIAGTVTLREEGDNTITAEGADNYGNVGSGSAVVRVQFTDPEMPVVYDDTHHNGYRDTALTQFTLAYGTPPYISLGAPRGVTLQFNGELASPSAYVAIDAKPEPRTAANVTAMSLKITDDSNGSVVGREFFWAKNPTGEKQRMAVWWNMRTRATGAYSYTAAVRSHFANGTFKEVRVPVRVLIVNESASRYGAGWTLAGIPQIYGAVGGLILHEGNGVLRWYGSTPCSPTLCTFVRPEGDFSDVQYDRVNGRLTRTFNDGSTNIFNDRGRLISATDSFGRTTSFTWTDIAGVPALTSIVDPAGKATTLGYTAAGYLQRITDPAGREVVATIDAAGDLVQLAGPSGLQIAYSATHLPSAFTGEHGTWNPNYYRGAFSSITAPAVVVDGGATTRPVTKFQRAEWKTTLVGSEGNSLTNLAPAVPSGNAVEEIVDPRNHKTVIARNRYGDVTTMIDLAGDVTGYSYTREGLLQSVEVEGKKTEYDWNARGQLIATRVDGVPDYQASYTRADKPDFEVSGGKKTWYTWGTRGELLRSWFGEQGDSTVNGTTYQYDGIYRLTGITGPHGERTEWTYDGVWGNIATTRTIREDGVGRTTTFSHDTKGWVYTTTNALGQRTLTDHDFRNRLRTIVDPLDRVTTLDYTGDRLTRVTDPAGKVHGFTFNGLGWLEAETFPDSTARLYTYDADGMLRSKKDRRGLTVRYSYDAAHRALGRVADGATTTFSYPDRYTSIATNAEGSQTTVYTPGTGQLDSVRMSLGGLPGRVYELKVALDPQNFLRPVGNDVILWNNGAHVRTLPIRYDSSPNGAGSLFHLTDPAGGTTTITYDASGNQTGVSFPNGIAHNQLFGTDGRVIQTWFDSAALNQTFGADFSYDVLSRLTKRFDLMERTEWTYGYTPLGQVGTYKQRASTPPVGCNPRIQTCAPTWSTIRSGAFTYDTVQNRTDSGAALFPNTNRYSTFAGYTLTYDVEGNLIRKTKSGFDQQLTWNALGQLASVNTNGAVVSYGYDALDRRVRRTADGFSRYFVYEEEDLLLELGPDGMPTRSYVHLPGTDRPLSVREYHPGNYEPMYYYLLERPGHVKGLLDAAGAAIGEYAYTPFGEQVATGKGDGINQPLRYMARELDSAARLYYVRARWYDPELGRFVSEDPIGLAGGINPYAYADNDPVNKTDPSGLSPECPNCLETVYVTCNHGYDPDCDAWWEDGVFERWANERLEQDRYDPNDYLRGAIVRPDPSGMGATPRMPEPEPARELPTIGPRPPESPFANLRKQQQCRFMRNQAAAWTGMQIFGALGRGGSARGTITRVGPATRNETFNSVSQPVMGTASGGYAGEAWSMYFEAGCGR